MITQWVWGHPTSDKPWQTHLQLQINFSNQGNQGVGVSAFALMGFVGCGWLHNSQKELFQSSISIFASQISMSSSDMVKSQDTFQPFMFHHCWHSMPCKHFEGSYPPAIKHGSLENSPWTSGISQLAGFDDTQG